MSISFNLISHTFENKSSQLLIDHLKGVRDIALYTAKEKGICDDDILNAIDLICMCHDFGKASRYFQNYIISGKSTEYKEHGEISAYFTYYMLPEKWKMIGFICVKRHHGNIDLDGSFFQCQNREKLIKISESIKNNKGEIEKIYDKNIDEFFKKIEDQTLFEEVDDDYYNLFCGGKSVSDLEERFIYIEYIWSILLTSDKTQLIRGNVFETRIISKDNIFEKYKDNIRKKFIKKVPNIGDNKLFKIRNYIFNQVKDNINTLNIDKNKILSLNVPTGTGKTIAAYEAAYILSLRLKKEKDISSNIIYTVPFMSIIDQNYDVLKSIFNFNNIPISSDLLLKHHSMTPLRYKDCENIEYKNYDARFLVENWQSTVITTTFIQLFNTIFKPGINSIVNRFNRLTGSIIILDEVQSLAPKYYKIIEDIFNILCEKFNCYIITVTETKPLFLQGKDLVSDSKNIFDNMDRIVLENHTEKALKISEFKNLLLTDIRSVKGKSILIILNTVKSALEVYKYLNDELGENYKVLYLSTQIIPLVRLKIIKSVKESSKNCILISTQLIEAGVDIDFDIVYRDIAPLSSINQSAGRANRNAIKGKGIVKIYKLVDKNDKMFAGYIYSKPLLEVTLKILEEKKKVNENELWNINNQYFNNLNKVTKHKCKEEYEKYCNYFKRLNFNKIREFKLIDDLPFKVDVFIRYDENVEKDIDIIESDADYQKKVNAWRDLNKYRISVDRDLINNIGTEIIGYTFINKEDYDDTYGIKNRTVSII
ncbi:CRISPR-associated helicase Cas3' [Clostridium sp. BJN0001]|uniref:CRISPR-associated helicase Cas3' n=1 Tax=Clostridium sp. BJN0001 TaxID=2930219 RepID=UPI001FD4F91F|nr:CRISPR-associated helicase Cas3' [Clostridium sp. BJN0001]